MFHLGPTYCITVYLKTGSYVLFKEFWNYVQITPLLLKILLRVIPQNVELQNNTNVCVCVCQRNKQIILTPAVISYLCYNQLQFGHKTRKFLFSTMDTYFPLSMSTETTYSESTFFYKKKGTYTRFWGFFL